MSGKNKLISKNVQSVKSQTEILSWLFKQPFGLELVSSLGSKAGIQNISAKEFRPALVDMSKKAKKKLSLPKLYFGARSGQQGWVLGVYAIPRAKSFNSKQKLVNKYLAGLDKVSQNQSLKTALVVISDEEVTKPEDATSQVGVVSWKDFVSSVKTHLDKNVDSIPPFRYATVTKWVDQWAFTEVFNNLKNEKYENMEIKVKIPYRLEKSTFTIKDAEKRAPVKVEGSLKSLKPSSSKLILELVLQKKGTKKWRRQWESALPNFHDELVEQFNQKGYSTVAKNHKTIEQFNKKTMRKLAKSSSRLKLEFPMEMKSNKWYLGDKSIDASLAEVTSVYVSKVAELLTWQPEEQPQEAPVVSA